MVNDMNTNEIRYASFDETMSRRVLRPRRKTSRYGIGFRHPFDGNRDGDLQHLDDVGNAETDGFPGDGDRSWRGCVPLD